METEREIRRPSRITSAPREDVTRYDFVQLRTTPETSCIVPLPVEVRPQATLCMSESVSILVSASLPAPDDDLADLELKLAATLRRLDDNVDIARRRSSTCPQEASDYARWQRSLCDKREFESQAAAKKAAQEADAAQALTWCEEAVKEIVGVRFDAELVRRDAAKEAARAASIEDQIRNDADARELRRQADIAASLTLREELTRVTFSSSDHFLAEIRRNAEEKRQLELAAANQADAEEIAELELRLRALTVSKKLPFRGVMRR